MVSAAVVVLFVFSGATFNTPVRELVRSFSISLLFSVCIGPLLGVAMPRFSPWIWRRIRYPFNWVAIAAVMAALGMVGCVAAIGVLIAAGVVPPWQFLIWFQGSVRI